MEINKNLELRMYGFVPYNLSEIQKGIQYGHAVVEYQQKYNNELYNDWAKNHKTFMILNGGPTPNTDEIGMRNIKKEFETLNYDHACFFEPDLNDALSGIAFIVDERVFNFKKYPDPDFLAYQMKSSHRTKAIKEWTRDVIGGEKNLFLRNYLRNFRLA